METEIDLQELNGLEMGCILHSNKACPHIAKHTSHEIRKSLINEIIKSDTKICLIIDEATALSNKSSFIVFIRFCIPEIGMDGPINLFIDLVELDSVTYRGIFDCMTDCLHSYGCLLYTS